MSTRGDGETVNVRRATVADAATISALNADVQAVHAAALPWLFKTPSAETFPPLGAVRQAADDRDIRQVALDVWSFNERAEAFFRRHGFEAYNERLWLR